MKKFLIGLLMTFIFYIVNAQEIDKKDLNYIKKQIKIISNELSKIKKSSNIGERKYFLDKINFYPELRIRIDNFRYKLKPFKAEQEVYNKNPDLATKRGANGFTKNYDPHYYVRLRLNMYTQFLENLKFIGRMLVVKHSQNNQRLCILSNSISSAGKAEKTIIEFDRAYIDWKFYKNKYIQLTLSLGILPTTGGQSVNLKENVPRKSFFPSLIFDTTSYGAIFTAKVSEDNWIRTVYGKGYTLNPDIFYFQCNRENIFNNDIFAIFFEKKLPFTKKGIIYLGFVRNANIKATPYLGQYTYQFLALQTSETANINPKYLKSLGDIYNIGTGFQIEKIKKKLDIFLNIGISIPKGNGNCMNYTSNSYPECKIGGQPLPSPPSANRNVYYTNAKYAGGPLLQKTGYAFHTGFRYTIKKLKKARTGVEFNYGSKWWWSATQGAEDVFNKLATRGYALETYHIQPFNRFIYLRVGYLYIKEKFSGSGWHFGYPAEKDGTMRNFYLLFNVRF